MNIKNAKSTKKRLALASMIAVCLSVPQVVNADESRSPYYEDDAWYDVSEWFDGNDYNPTDEAIGRWDDETFEFADKWASSDIDNDAIWGDYGYADDTPANERWFYDHYDDGYSDWQDQVGFASYTFYYDVDSDGLYDSFSLYYDSDNDGVYDSYTYTTLTPSADDGKFQSESRDKQKSLNSQLQEVSGTVAKSKTVSVRDSKHLVAWLETDGGEKLAVDLGPRKSVVSIGEGDQLTAAGHKIKVGEKSLLIATTAKSNAVDLKVDRNGRQYTGKVVSTREVSVRDQKHLLAKVQTDEGKVMLVDLGQKGRLSNEPSKGSHVTVQGVPVRVKDRVVLMARTLGHEGKKVEIERDASQQNSKS